MTQLRAGIIGVGGYGRLILRELAGNDRFVIKAIADQDRELAQACSREYGGEPYDDYRGLIVQQELDALFLVLPTFLCGEYIRLSAKKGIHVFKAAPLGRTMPEAAEWVELMDRADCRLYVSVPNRFAPGYLGAHQLLQEEKIGSVYLVRAESFSRYHGDLGWRGDPVLAGGGVLLEQAYDMVDQIIWNLGPPERLYGLNGNRCSERALPPYKTEDTAVLTMRFPDGTMGSVLAGWMTGPTRERVLFHGTDGSIEVTRNSVRCFDVDGECAGEEEFDVNDAWLVAQEIRHFAELLLDDEIEPVGTAAEHLADVAVIESAYLSAKTQLPESLRVYGSLFDVDD